MQSELVDGMTLDKLFQAIEEQQRRCEHIRLHPNGFLQLPLSLGKDQRTSDLRLHIWTDQLPLRGDSAYGIHDHIFDIHSSVLLGSLFDTTYMAEENPPGEYFLFQSDGKGQLNYAENRYSCTVSQQRIIPAGCSYRLPKRAFHTSAPQCSVVATVMRKTNIDPQARSRVLSLQIQPRVEVDRSIDQALAWDAVRLVQERIRY